MGHQRCRSGWLGRVAIRRECAQFSGAAAANFMGTLGAYQQDHIGSSLDDLLVAGTDELGGYAMCLLDGERLDGPINCDDDAEVRWTGADSAFPRVVNHLDIDGDGLQKSYMRILGMELGPLVWSTYSMEAPSLVETSVSC